MAKSDDADMDTLAEHVSRHGSLALAFSADGEAALAGGCGLRALLDAHPAPWAAVAALIEMGTDRALLGQLTGAGDLGLAQVSLGRDGRFEFGGPARRLILGVRAGGVLVDLVALSSTRADEWALYRGAADFLGEDRLERAIGREVREVRLFSTPFDWLRGGGEGVCVLDWTASALGGLRGLGRSAGGGPATLVCDAGAGERLKAMLAFGGLPIVAEARPKMRRAA